eukprot:gene4384-5129_t
MSVVADPRRRSQDPSVGGERTIATSLDSSQQQPVIDQAEEDKNRSLNGSSDRALPPPPRQESKPTRQLSMSVSDVSLSTGGSVDSNTSQAVQVNSAGTSHSSSPSSSPPQVRRPSFKPPPKSNSAIYSVIYDKTSQGLDHVDEEDLLQRVNLQRVILGRNKLESIPARIGELTYVNTLDLSYNRLKQLPASVANMTSLTNLLLAGNQFLVPAKDDRSSQPDLASLARSVVEPPKEDVEEEAVLTPLSEITTPPFINGSNNSLSSLSAITESSPLPSELSYLTMLRKIDLTSNVSPGDWEGENYLPPSLFWCSQVQTLLVPHCQIRTLSADIQHLELLVHLDLSYNALKELPIELGHLKSLTYLSARDNQIRVVPDELAHLESLTTLDLSHNVIEGIPADFCYLTSLETLNLSHNRITSLPPALFGETDESYALFSLNDLRIRGNLIVELPSRFFSIQCAYVYLDLSDNRLTHLPEIPASTGREMTLESLTTILLFNNRLTSIPSELFKQSPSLLTLNLSDNLLETLPSNVWRDCSSLSHLSLGYNRLGVFPFPTETFYSLEELYLSGNEHIDLSTIDHSEFPTLHELSLGLCGLTNVPPFVYKCTSLDKLDLSNNLLTSVANDIASIENMVILDLAHNKLTQLPDKMDALKNLVMLDVSFNLLTNVSPTIITSNPSLHLIHHHNANDITDIPSREIWKESDRFNITMSEMMGRRPTMEDAFTVRGKFCNKKDYDLVALFDGHAGVRAATYSCEWFPTIVNKLIDIYPSLPPQQWLKQAYSEISSQFKQHVNTSAPELKYCGATAAAVLLNRSHYYVSNIGDTRIVLCRGGNAQRISFDHKPNDPKEELRIRRLGGFVQSNCHTSRVNGTLAVSRSIGDFYMEPFVIPDPYLSITEASPNDEFLIVACDGVWDEISDQAACDIVSGCSSMTIAAQKLRDFAYFKGSDDNITVIIIDLKAELSGSSSK